LNPKVRRILWFALFAFGAKLAAFKCVIVGDSGMTALASMAPK
jgi:hypothetical protein